MIIAVSVALVSAVALAMSNAKKASVEADLNFVKDSYKGLLEENRVLNTCLEAMEPKLLELQKEALEISTNLVKERENNLAKEREKAESLNSSYISMVNDRDMYQRLFRKQMHEAEAYKQLYESELTKKAPQ